MFTRFRQLLQALQADTRGNVAMLTGLSVFVLLTSTGVAVDMAREQMLQAKIQTALDAAGLAAGATASSINVQTQATRYFNANFPSGYMGSAPVTVNAALATGGSVVTLSAATTQPTTFLQVVGITTVNVGANSQITRANQGLELTLVLDNTGSMADPVSSGSSVAKIDALKCALGGNLAEGATSTFCSSHSLVTTGLLDILYGTSTSMSDMFISLVPFGDIVNIPTSQKSIITSASSGGCVNARSTTVASRVEPSFQVTYDNGTTTTATLELDQAPDAPAASPYNFTKLSSSDCPAASLIPLVQTKSTLLTGIRTMAANGNTMLNIGLAWGWRTLSPDWQSSWVGLPTFTNTTTNVSYTLPLNYGTPQMNKVVVMMTDGVNTQGNNSAYGNGNAPNVTTLDNKTIEICTAMKNRNIIIYTIGFGPSSGVNTTLLTKCATKPAYFFLAPTNAELATAFEQIGDSLANLRVSQ